MWGFHDVDFELEGSLRAGDQDELDGRSRRDRAFDADDGRVPIGVAGGVSQ